MGNYHMSHTFNQCLANDLNGNKTRVTKITIGLKLAKWFGLTENQSLPLRLNANIFSSTILDKF